MSKLRLFDPDANDSFESMFRRMMRPWRFDKELFKEFKKDGVLSLELPKKAASSAGAKRLTIQ